MIRFLLFIFIVFSQESNAQESPKNIISEENKNILKQEGVILDENNDLNLEDTNIKKETESQNYNSEVNSENEEQNAIVVEDLPNNFNPWHGILSSDNEGLGWMMWGNTNYLLSSNLIDQVNPSTYSPTLNKLLKNFLLSRAKGPTHKIKEDRSLVNNKSSSETLPFLEKKIAYLIQTGYQEDLKNFISSIPQNLKTNNFEEKHFQIRLNNFDVVYLCSNISKMLSQGNRLTLHRKILIVCKLILNKEEEAMLAMELLENDILEEDNFLKNVRKYLSETVNDKISEDHVFSDESNLLKILSFYDYETAKKTFKDMPRIFNKTVYDLKLYSKELQIESLEFLVNQGVYPGSKLIEEYNSLVAEEELASLFNKNEKINIKENTVKTRAILFKLINLSISKVDRAKYLMTLWDLGYKKNIFRATAVITKNSVLSLSPDPTLNWFNLSAFKALLLSEEVEASKKWIFYGTSDVKERASIDISFCKLLILLYMHDKNTQDSLNEFLDINHLLNILFNDFNIDEKKFVKLILTLGSLGEKIPNEMWETFLDNQSAESNAFNFFRFDVSKYFLLDNAIIKGNLAEATLLSFILLQSEKETYKESFSFYKGIEGLYLAGLEKYARNYAIEENLYFLLR